MYLVNIYVIYVRKLRKIKYTLKGTFKQDQKIKIEGYFLFTETLYGLWSLTYTYIFIHISYIMLLLDIIII